MSEVSIVRGAPSLSRPTGDEQFSKTSRWSAVSASGFWVQIEAASGVSYADAEGCVFFDVEGRVFLEAESLVSGIRICLDSPRNRGLEYLSRRRVDEILQRTAHALRFLGYQCETRGRIPAGVQRWWWRMRSATLPPFGSRRTTPPGTTRVIETAPDRLPY